MVVELILTFTGSVEFSDFAKKSQICTFVPSTVHLAAFAIYLKKLTLSDLLSPQWCVAADNCPGCARL